MPDHVLGRNGFVRAVQRRASKHLRERVVVLAQEAAHRVRDLARVVAYDEVVGRAEPRLGETANGARRMSHVSTVAFEW